MSSYIQLPLIINYNIFLTWVRVMSIMRRSGTPSPVTAEVGTRLTVCAGSSFSQYSFAFRPVHKQLKWLK